MVHERPKMNRPPAKLIMIPVGSPKARRAALSKYLTGAYECVGHLCVADVDDPHRHTLGNRTYVAFANVQDRLSRLTRSIVHNAHTFLSLAHLQKYTCVNLDDLITALEYEEDIDQKKAINFLIATSCGWPYLIRETIKDFGPPVLLGSLDQVGCAWDEDEDGPQLCFRID